jgi:hypothetical protein
LISIKKSKEYFFSFPKDEKIIIVIMLCRSVGSLGSVTLKRTLAEYLRKIVIKIKNYFSYNRSNFDILLNCIYGHYSSFKAHEK